MPKKKNTLVAVDPKEELDGLWVNGVPVFVYGSLLSGLQNNPRLHSPDVLPNDKDDMFKKPWEAVTDPHFTMYDLGHFPGVVRGGDTAIQGEVYLVGPVTLLRLDQLEGHPVCYRREVINVETKDFGRIQVYTYIYVSQNRLFLRKRDIVDTGDWKTYFAPSLPHRKHWVPWQDVFKRGHIRPGQPDPYAHVYRKIASGNGK